MEPIEPPDGTDGAAARDAVRRADADDWRAVHRLFLDSVHAVEAEDLAHLDGRLFEPTRSLVVRAGPRLVAHVGSYLRQLTVPGGVVGAAHVAAVAVAAEHRRQGLLTRLVRRQLADAREAGEPVAVLWATEGRIYPRFGYGLATVRLDVDADRRRVGLHRSSGFGDELRSLDLESAEAVVRPLFERAAPDRPGWSGRGDRWWQDRVLADPPSRRRGATPWRVTAHEGPAGADGYAIWRVRPGQGDGPGGAVEVREVVSASARAYEELWGFLLSLELTDAVRYPLAAVDEPLLHLVGDPRRLRARVADGLWLRLTDVPAALAARRYQTSIDLVLEVTDPLLGRNEGRWRLSGDPSGAGCEPTTAAADLVCDVRDLGAAYLGNGGLLEGADLGRVRECRAGAVRAAHTAFGWHRRPSVVERF